MQAGLVLFAFKICAPELEHSSVIPPDETADSALEEVCDGDIRPKPISSIDVLGRESRKSSDIAVFCASDVVDGNQDAATDYAEDNENVAEHT